MPRKGWHQLARFKADGAEAPRRPRAGGALRAGSLVDVPLAWVVVAAVLLDPSNARELGAAHRVAVLWLATLLGAGLLIQVVGPLRFIGEGFRYFEFGLVPLGVLLAALPSVVPPAHRAVVGAVALAAALLAVAQMSRLARASRLETAARDERAVRLAGRMAALPVERWLVLPLQYAPMLAVEAGKDVLMMLGEKGADRSEDFYPRMEAPPSKFVREFALGGVFLDTRYARPEDLGLGALALLDQEGPFAAYGIGGADERP
jgi:hypothetical protein